MRSGSTRRAVLVDPQPLWLRAVEGVLERVPVEVVGKANSLEEGSRLIALHDPTLVVAELSAPQVHADGFAWLADVLQGHPETKVIVLLDFLATGPEQARCRRPERGASHVDASPVGGPAAPGRRPFQPRAGKDALVTEQTVKFHVSNIYRKLKVPNRTGASRWAQLNGLLPADPVGNGQG